MEPLKINCKDYLRVRNLQITNKNVYICIILIIRMNLEVKFIKLNGCEAFSRYPILDKFMIFTRWVPVISTPGMLSNNHN